MTTSEKGYNLIKKYESLQLKAYKCPAGIWTIGYGHTGVGVNQGKQITESLANEILISDVSKVEKKINELGLNFNQNQFDAIVSLTFNIGFGNLRISTLLSKAKVDVNDKSILFEFSRWNKGRVNGVLKELPGLTKRRKEESDLYFNV
jgi:lysozyme